MTYRRWTKREEQYLAIWYALKGPTHCGKKLRRTRHAVVNKARKMMLEYGVPNGYTKLSDVYGATDDRGYRRGAVSEVKRVARAAGVAKQVQPGAPIIVPTEWADAYARELDARRAVDARAAREGWLTTSDFADALGCCRTSVLKTRKPKGGADVPLLSEALEGVESGMGTSNCYWWEPIGCSMAVIRYEHERIRLESAA